jgi:hypothetical protein
VGEAAAEVVGGELAGDAREDLSLSGKAAERACVEDAGAVASEGGPVGMVGLRISARNEFSFPIYGDGRGEEKALSRQFAHPD